MANKTQLLEAYLQKFDGCTIAPQQKRDAKGWPMSQAGMRVYEVELVTIVQGVASCEKTICLRKDGGAEDAINGEWYAVRASDGGELKDRASLVNWITHEDRPWAKNVIAYAVNTELRSASFSVIEGGLLKHYVASRVGNAVTYAATTERFRFTP